MRVGQFAERVQNAFCFVNTVKSVVVAMVSAADRPTQQLEVSVGLKNRVRREERTVELGMEPSGWNDLTFVRVEIQPYLRCFCFCFRRWPCGSGTIIWSPGWLMGKGCDESIWMKHPCACSKAMPRAARVHVLQHAFTRRAACRHQDT